MASSHNGLHLKIHGPAVDVLLDRLQYCIGGAGRGALRRGSAGLLFRTAVKYKSHQVKISSQRCREHRLACGYSTDIKHQEMSTMQTLAINTSTSNSYFSSTLVSGSIYLCRPKLSAEMPGPFKNQGQCHGNSDIYVQQMMSGDNQSPSGCHGQDNEAQHWRTQRLDSADLHADTQVLRQTFAQSHLSIVSVETRLRSEPRLTSTRVARANQARMCPTCREVFTETFGMPEEWWSGHYRNANGYFGCVEQDLGGAPTIGAFLTAEFCCFWLIQCQILGGDSRRKWCAVRQTLNGRRSISSHDGFRRSTRPRLSCLTCRHP